MHPCRASAPERFCASPSVSPARAAAVALRAVVALPDCSSCELTPTDAVHHQRRASRLRLLSLPGDPRQNQNTPATRHESRRHFPGVLVMPGRLTAKLRVCVCVSAWRVCHSVYVSQHGVRLSQHGVRRNLHLPVEPALPRTAGGGRAVSVQHQQPFLPSACRCVSSHGARKAVLSRPFARP